MSHGLGLAMLLPSVVGAIYKEKKNVLNYILEPIAKNIENPKDASKKVYEWLKSVGVLSKLKDEGFAETDVEKLVDLAQTTPSLDLLLSLAPNEATPDRIKEIYKNSL